MEVARQGIASSAHTATAAQARRWATNCEATGQVVTGDRRVVLVCGPPGSGKTTWARASSLTVYDRDDPHWLGERHFTSAIAGLAYDPDAQAAVIRSGATQSARDNAANLIGATETQMIDTDAHECKRRVHQRNRARPPMQAQLASIDQWWATYEPIVTASRDW